MFQKVDCLIKIETEVLCLYNKNSKTIMFQFYKVEFLEIYLMSRNKLVKLITYI